MKTGELQEMSLLGLTISKGKDKPCYYVEYHQCDRCGVEYRVYVQSENNLEKTLAHLRNIELGRAIVSREKDDLCFHCQSHVIATQSILSLEA